MIDVILAAAVLMAEIGFMVWVLIPTTSVRKYHGYVKAETINIIANAMRLYPDQHEAIAYIRHEMLGD